jgi:Calcineurin-like phosphoesterase/Purple acid Phosphatase, N-terminal domain
MANDEQLFRSHMSRRGLLAAGGAVGAGVAVGPLLGGTATAAVTSAAGPSAAALAAANGAAAAIGGAAGDPVNTPAVNGLHLQFGADPAREIVVSWHTLQPVHDARVLLGGTDGRYKNSYHAETLSYTDGKSGQTVYAQHAHISGLRPNQEYVYLAVHDGAQPVFGSFTTAPTGRQSFTFTSFGDQGTPTTGKVFVPPAGVTIANPPFVNDNLGGPASANTPAGIERVQPLFHLFNGDLCYANLATDRVKTWSDFWDNNTRSARNRPWMPAPGNHENERGNGPIGYQAFQTYFATPRQPGQTDVTRGLWYALTVGSVRVIFLANDDVCLQDGGDSYVHGYSNGAQKAWLERELSQARRDRDIDWIVVCMHQVAISTADQFNGADLGIRQDWLPLFDQYGVDLVVCGHEHHYERSHPIRGRQANATLTPIPASTRTDVIDTSKGTVHMVIGGGGTSAPSNRLFFNPPACRVITSVTAPDPITGKRAPVYTHEDAPWSAVRDAANSYGFAAFTVDPGRHRGDLTTITVTYYDVVGIEGNLRPFESFKLQRRRSDG